MRSDREEAVLPRVPGRAGVQLRHARLRSALRLLPELGDVAGAARSGRGRAAARGIAETHSSTTRCASARACIVSTYNEPLITSEWAVAVFKAAKAAGLVTGYVSNGNGTPQVLEYLRPWVDLYKVDLKSFDDRHYRQLGGRLEPILDTIRRLHAMGFWVEIVTLLIPGFNDSRDELTRLTAFIAGVSPDIPWHVTAFHGDYKMTRARQHDRRDAADRCRDRPRERPALRLRRQPARPGRRSRRHALCATCGDLLIARCGYFIREYRITADGRCPGLRGDGAGPLGLAVWRADRLAPVRPGRLARAATLNAGMQ